jgi:glycosyltransferase involved in cell wall biosynthesis
MTGVQDSLDATARLILDITSSTSPEWRGPLGPEQLELAHHHGLLGLLATNPMDDLRTVAIAPYTRLHARQVIMAKHTRRLLERLHAASVRATILKGSHLAEHVYRDPRHRTFTDVDVLVPEEDLSKALDALAADPAVARLPKKRPKADKRDIAVKDESGIWFMVDLHWDLFSYTQLQGCADGATSWAWNNSSGTPESPLGPITQIPPEAYVSFLCTHALLDHRFRMILFRDLAELADRGADWEAIARFASRWRVRSFTYLALEMASRFAGARVPEGFLAELRPSNLPLDAIEALLTRIDPVRFDGHRPHPLNLAMVLLHDERATRLKLLAHAPSAAPQWWRRFGRNPVRRRAAPAPPRAGSAPRVLILVSSDQRRGAEVFADQLARGLLERQWSASLLALAGTGTDTRVNADVVTRRSPSELGRLDPAVVWGLRRRIRHWRPDVVLANGGATLRYAVAALVAMRGRPRLAYASIGEPDYWIRGPSHRWIQQRLHKRADMVLAVSEATRAQLIDRVGLGPERITVAPIGVPEQLLHVNETPHEDHLRLLFVGSLSTEKNPVRAIETLRQLREHTPARLRFVGAGPLEVELRRLANAPSLQGLVEFAGSVEDVTPHLAWADVLVLPSITEGLPGAVLEAAAAGVPGVANDVGGTREALIDGETGILVDPADERGLAEQLRWLATDRARLARLGAAARARVVDEFLMDAAVDRYAAALEDLLPERRRRRVQRSAVPAAQ